MSQKITRRRIARYVASQLHAGENPAQLAKRTAAYLADTKQTGQMELLIRDVEAELANQYDIVTARVTSAHELSPATRDAITKFVAAAEGARSVVIADEATDPDLIGGVVISTPSSHFDSSIRTKLRQLTATSEG